MNLTTTQTPQEPKFGTLLDLKLDTLEIWLDDLGDSLTRGRGLGDALSVLKGVRRKVTEIKAELDQTGDQLS